jgi:hypothetical protein
MANESETPTELKVFSIVHDWPGRDEGDYAWAGEAIDQDHAIKRCVESMIGDDMALDPDDDAEEVVRRREAIEDESPRARIYEGADIWQAPALMEAIKQALDLYPDSVASAMEGLRDAYRRGRGYEVELVEAQEWFQEDPCKRSATCLSIVAARYLENDWVDKRTIQGITDEIRAWENERS